MPEISEPETVGSGATLSLEATDQDGYGTSVELTNIKTEMNLPNAAPGEAILTVTFDYSITNTTEGGRNLRLTARILNVALPSEFCIGGFRGEITDEGWCRAEIAYFGPSVFGDLTLGPGETTTGSFDWDAAEGEVQGRTRITVREDFDPAGLYFAIGLGPWQTLDGASPPPDFPYY